MFLLRLFKFQSSLAINSQNSCYQVKPLRNQIMVPLSVMWFFACFGLFAYLVSSYWYAVERSHEAMLLEKRQSIAETFSTLKVTHNGLVNSQGEAILGPRELLGTMPSSLKDVRPFLSWFIKTEVLSSVTEQASRLALTPEDLRPIWNDEYVVLSSPHLPSQILSQGLESASFSGDSLQMSESEAGKNLADFFFRVLNPSLIYRAQTHYISWGQFPYKFHMFPLKLSGQSRPIGAAVLGLDYSLYFKTIFILLGGALFAFFVGQKFLQFFLDKYLHKSFFNIQNHEQEIQRDLQESHHHFLKHIFNKLQHNYADLAQAVSQINKTEDHLARVMDAKEKFNEKQLQDVGELYELSHTMQQEQEKFYDRFLKLSMLLSDVVAKKYEPELMGLVIAGDENRDFSLAVHEKILSLKNENLIYEEEVENLVSSTYVIDQISSPRLLSAIELAQYLEGEMSELADVMRQMKNNWGAEKENLL